MGTQATEAPLELTKRGLHGAGPPSSACQAPLVVKGLLGAGGLFGQMSMRVLCPYACVRSSLVLCRSYAEEQPEERVQHSG